MKKKAKKTSPQIVIGVIVMIGGLIIVIVGLLQANSSTWVGGIAVMSIGWILFKIWSNKKPNSKDSVKP